MKALVGAFNQEKALVGAFSVIVQPVVESMDRFTALIRNLGEPGSKHGFHVHEKADFSDGCKSAGPHWNPLNLDHGAPEDEIRHVGGLGNIVADAEGHSKGSMSDHQVKLFEHEKFGSVVGRSMMIHAKEDDLGLGDNSKANEPGPPQDGFVSKITGNAGARIACGEIKLVE